jgi:type IV secretion system protein TrbL
VSRGVRIAVGVGVGVGVVVGALAVVGVAAAQSGAPVSGPYLDGIRDAYRLAAGGWRARLVPMAQRTFMLLAAIEFCVSGLMWAMKRDALDDLAAKFLLKFTLISFLLTLITSFDLWFPAILNGFAAAGEQVIGRGTMSPDAIIGLGGSLAYSILKSISFTVLAHDVLIGAFGLVCAVAVAGSYIAIAIQLLVVMIESYVVVLGGGVLFLGFAASRWTAAFAEHVVAYTFFLGARIFLLYLFVGVGMDVTRQFVQVIASSQLFAEPSPLLQVTGGALAFAYIVTKVPYDVAWKLTGRHSLGLAQALRALS